MTAVIKVNKQDTSKYGILETGSQNGDIVEIKGLVEKPHPDEAPSDLAIIGRYILTPEIFQILGKQKRGAGNEIQLTDAMSHLLTKQSISGFRFKGTRYDCGDKTGYQMANIAFALERPDMSLTLMPFLKTFC